MSIYLEKGKGGRGWAGGIEEEYRVKGGMNRGRRREEAHFVASMPFSDIISGKLAKPSGNIKHGVFPGGRKKVGGGG